MVLHPSVEGWLCRSKRPAGGSTPPRQRCSPAGLQVGWLRLRLGPEGPLDLEGKKQRAHWYTGKSSM